MYNVENYTSSHEKSSFITLLAADTASQAARLHSRLIRKPESRKFIRSLHQRSKFVLDFCVEAVKLLLDRFLPLRGRLEAEFLNIRF